jgi:hypothetical protein
MENIEDEVFEIIDDDEEVKVVEETILESYRKITEEAKNGNIEEFEKRLIK